MFVPRAFAECAYAGLCVRHRAKVKLKQAQKKSKITPIQKDRSLVAARLMGKEAFFGMTRAALRKWAKKYKVTYGGGKSKAAEQVAILSKIGSAWLL